MAEKKKAPAKKTTAKKAAKKAPAKKAPAKKAPAKKAPAKKAPAKKTTAKKAPAKKTTAKNTPVAAPATETTTIALPGGVELAMVRIPGKDYWMGKFPVAQEQYEAVTGENPSGFKSAENPVECVSWGDCQAFLKTLNAQPAAKASGLVFRLPTEEEWEFACLAGATVDYWLGAYCKLADGTEITDETLDEVAWFDENLDDTTHPVGRKKPNAFGLYDMLGNVWEWTATAVDDEGEVDADGGNRVTRGGCWYNSDSECESTNRSWDSPSVRLNWFGFRLCADRRAD